jgi:hypothetical protein
VLQLWHSGEALDGADGVRAVETPRTIDAQRVERGIDAALVGRLDDLGFNADLREPPANCPRRAVPLDLLIPAYTGTKLTSCFTEAGFVLSLRPRPEPSSPQA